VAIVPQGPLANHIAAQYAATTSLVALFGRAPAGGQFIDVSMQDVVALGAGSAPRQAVDGVYPCRDGFVLLCDTGDGPGAGWRDLVEWIAASLPEAARLLGPAWQDEGYKATNEAKAAFRDLFARFAAHRHKQDLLEEGQRRGIAITSIHEADESFNDPHFAARKVIGSGAPYHLGATPWRAGRRAPRLGEHTERLRKRLKIATS
jgi:benzylsuccinate CoA-transferase BbsE subunit